MLSAFLSATEGNKILLLKSMGADKIADPAIKLVHAVPPCPSL